MAYIMLIQKRQQLGWERMKLYWRRREEIKMRDGEHVSWEDVLSSRKDKGRQEHHPVKEAKNKYLRDAMPCPSCKRPANQLSWIYLLTPEWTWQTLCGKAGWITVCDQCNVQIDFFPEIVN
jgi:hypothetical protein